MEKEVNSSPQLLAEAELCDPFDDKSQNIKEKNQKAFYARTESHLAALFVIVVCLCVGVYIHGPRWGRPNAVDQMVLQAPGIVRSFKDMQWCTALHFQKDFQSIGRVNFYLADPFSSYSNKYHSSKLRFRPMPPKTLCTT